jgi:hypothetical protein
VGEIDTIEKAGSIVQLSGAFVDTDAAKQIRSTKKLAWDCSLAFDMASAIIEEVGPEATAEVNGAQLAGPATIIRKAQLYETSFTHFGAVPGASAAFNESMVSVSIFSRGGSMSADPKTVQTDDAMGRFRAMNAISKDAAFVAECFEKGMSLESFQSALLAKQSEQIAKLTADLAAAKAAPVAGPAPVSFQAPVEPVAPLTFVQAAQKMHDERNIPFAQAYSHIAKTQPQLYQAHLDSAPITNK